MTVTSSIRKDVAHAVEEAVRGVARAAREAGTPELLESAIENAVRAAFPGATLGTISIVTAGLKGTFPTHFRVSNVALRFDVIVDI